MDSEEPSRNNNILIWAHNSSPFESNEQLRTSSYSQRRRASFTDKHPLLAKLEEAENEDLKHSDYAAHLIIQQRTREYAYAVDDTITLLKKGSEQILENIAYWRGFEPANGKSYTSWIHAAAGVRSASKGHHDEDITRVGKKVLSISESIKSIHDEDALTFWTSDQRKIILELLVSLSKDLVKLRRKLGRVKDGVNERLRRVRRVAILTECEITGNLVPSEIYYEWVKEDAKMHRTTDFGCKTRVNISVQEIPSKKGTEEKSKVNLFKKVMFSLASCVQAPAQESESDTDSDVSSLSLGTTFTSVLEPLDISIEKPSKEKVVEVETLHRPSQEFNKEEESVCSESMENMNMVNNGPPVESKGLLEDAWSPKPSQKYLDIITANVACPKKFSASSYTCDRNDYRIREDISHLVDGCVLNKSDVAILDDHQQNENITSSSVSTGLSLKTDEESETDPKVLILSNNNPYEAEAQEYGERYEDLTAAYFSGDESSMSSNASSSGKGKIMSDSMKQQVHHIMKTGRIMHEIINETTWALRGLERMWLSPPENLVKSKKNSTTELYKLVDLIVDTAKLTQNPIFASRLYPEDKHEIISVLDPVLREFTNCYMALYVLHSLVTVDTNYLKELLAGFPRGSLVIQEWVSDPSLDEDLGGMDQHSTTGSDFDVDVEEIFE